MNLDELRICLGTEETRRTGQTSEGDDAGEAELSLPMAAPAVEARRHPGLNGSEPVQARHQPIQDKLAEIEMAARLGYLLCQCTWPPQIMVLGDDGQLFRCSRCRRRRDF